jgi:hypothetical protein
MGIEFLFVFWFLVALTVGLSWWLVRSRSTVALLTTILSSVFTTVCFGGLALIVLLSHGAPVSSGFEQHPWSVLAFELLLPFWLSTTASAIAIAGFVQSRS